MYTQVRNCAAGPTQLLDVPAFQLLFATVIERVIFHTRTSFLSVLGTIIILSAALWVAVSIWTGFSAMQDAHHIQCTSSFQNKTNRHPMWRTGLTGTS